MKVYTNELAIKESEEKSKMNGIDLEAELFTQEDYQKIEKGILLICEGAVGLIRAAIDSVNKLVEETIKNIDWLLIYDCPNTRIKHLALHSKKARVRKKNMKRALKEKALNIN